MAGAWQAVTVTQGAASWPGWLLAWQRPTQPGGPWRALVRYRVGVGLQREHWVGQHDVQPR